MVTPPTGLGPSSRTAKSPSVEGLEGSVYTPKNELSISAARFVTTPNPGPTGGKPALENLPIRARAAT